MSKASKAVSKTGERAKKVPSTHVREKRSDRPPALSRAQLADARRRAQAALDAMSEEEDAEITAAALADPDAQPVDDLLRRRGRPALPPERKKVPVFLKLDPDVVQRFKAGGAGWQTRMNAALRKAAGLK
jgi:uncharacterized protein (DUF4415 family)